MALARNLRRKERKKFKIKLPKFKKKFVILVFLLAVGIGGYGIFNLTKLAPAKKEEVKYESTGDRPLPQKIVFWVKADGGLYLREEPNSKGKILKIVPNATQLEAVEVQGEWYKAVFAETAGWVNQSYTTTQAPAEDATKNWNNYSNKTIGYTLRYPAGWVMQDYGANPASESVSYVAFGVQLPAQLDPAKLPPVVVRISSKPREAVVAAYKAYSGSVAEAATVSGLTGDKFTYNSSSGIQMTAFVVGKGQNTYIIEETGGFIDELTGIVNSLNLP